MAVITTRHVIWTLGEWWNAWIERGILFAWYYVGSPSPGYEVQAVIDSGRVAVVVRWVSGTPPSSTTTEDYFILGPHLEGSLAPLYLVLGSPGFGFGVQVPMELRRATMGDAIAEASAALAEFSNRMVDTMPTLLLLLCGIADADVSAQPFVEDEDLGVVSKTIRVSMIDSGIRVEFATPLVFRCSSGAETGGLPVERFHIANIGVRTPAVMAGVGVLSKAIEDLAKRDLQVHVTPHEVRVINYPPED